MVIGSVPAHADRTGHIRPAGAGRFNFVRTPAGAIYTAVVVAVWINAIDLQGGGFTQEQAGNLLDLTVQRQSVMLRANLTFLYAGIVMLIAAASVWLAPEPPHHDNGKPPTGH